MLIGISGKIGSGKDIIGKMIQCLAYNMTDEQTVEWCKSDKFVSHAKWKIKKFAGKLKQVVSILTGIDQDLLEKQDVKNSTLDHDWDRYIQYQGKRVISAEQPYPHIPKESMTVRTLLQEIGTDALRDCVHPNIWVNALFSDYRVATYHDIGEERTLPNWVITDVRFPNEAEAILNRGGILLRVDRVTPRQGLRSEHPSETALDNYPKFTEVIENNGTIEELVQKIKEVLQKHKIVNNKKQK